MRVRQVVLLAVTALALTACDPYFVTGERDYAEIDLDLGADGSADVDLSLGGPPSHDRLREVGEAVAPALLPTARSRSVDVTQSFGRGSEYVHLRGTGIYQTGSHPVADLDLTPALLVLREMGYRHVDVIVAAPRVPATASWQPSPDRAESGLWIWRDVGPGDQAPAGSVRMNPQPPRGIVELTLFGISVLGVVVAAFTRRRRRTIAAAAAGVALAAIAVGFVLTAATEHLGVAGMLGTTGLKVGLALPALSLGVGAAALFLLVVALVEHRIPKG